MALRTRGEDSRVLRGEDSRVASRCAGGDAPRMRGALLALVAVVACARAREPAADVATRECPPPIGRITLDDDCATQPPPLDGAYQTSDVALREELADEARVAAALFEASRADLCRRYDDCRLTTAAYRKERASLFELHRTLASLVGRLESADASTAPSLRAELEAVRFQACPTCYGPKKPAPLADGTYVLRPKALTKCLDTEGSKDEVVLHDCPVGPGQRWKLSGRGDGTVSFRSVVTRKCIVLSVREEGSDLRQQRCDDDRATRWWLVARPDGTHRIVSLQWKQCLEPASATDVLVVPRECGDPTREEASWFVTRIED